MAADANKEYKYSFPTSSNSSSSLHSLDLVSSVPFNMSTPFKMSSVDILPCSVIHIIGSLIFELPAMIAKPPSVKFIAYNNVSGRKLSLDLVGTESSFAPIAKTLSLDKVAVVRDFVSKFKLMIASVRLHKASSTEMVSVLNVAFSLVESILSSMLLSHEFSTNISRSHKRL